MCYVKSVLVTFGSFLDTILSLSSGRFGTHFGAFGGGLGVSKGFLGGPGVLGGLLGSMWGVTWLQERVSQILAPAGAAIGTHFGPKLGACCGQVGTFWGHLGDEVDILRLSK